MKKANHSQKKKVGFIGTLGFKKNQYLRKRDLTTSDSLSLNKDLEEMKKEGIENVIIEASSHGLKQKRLDLLKEGPDQTITKENIPPELIENFLTKFPEYSYVFEGASGGRAGYMGGGIAGIRKPHAIPPERQGLRSIMINVNDD